MEPLPGFHSRDLITLCSGGYRWQKLIARETISWGHLVLIQVCTRRPVRLDLRRLLSSVFFFSAVFFVLSPKKRQVGQYNRDFAKARVKKMDHDLGRDGENLTMAKFQKWFNDGEFFSTTSVRFESYVCCG